MPAHVAAEPSASRRLARRYRALGVALLALLVSVPMVGLFGKDLLVLERPEPGEVVGLTGVQVLVSLPVDGRVEPSTLRVLLNGADVTHALETARNGAAGRVQGLLDGENVLRVEVFGRRPWLPAGWIETSREVRVLFRPPLDLDRG